MYVNVGIADNALVDGTVDMHDDIVIDGDGVYFAFVVICFNLYLL